METDSINLVRACASCEREHGLRPNPEASHGYCKRHALAMWDMILSTGWSEKRARERAAVAARPASEFPEDLGAVEMEVAA